ncbi:MAG: glycoside hydrolase family 172 protein [Bryobacteraceae bacterium]
MEHDHPVRRGFLSNLFGAGVGVAGAGVLRAQGPAVARPANPGGLAGLSQARSGRRKRISSSDKTGRNDDRIRVKAGGTATLAEIDGAGSIRHIWMTIADGEPDYLRRLVLRAYWDGESQPSVESPLGDFFGVGHAKVAHYSSMPLNMVSGGSPLNENQAAMNCFFPMPFARHARLTLTNDGEKPAHAVYFYVDYEAYDRLPAGELAFHAQWRRNNPTTASVDLADAGLDFGKTNDIVNTSGAGNYVILDAQGRGHYAGCNLSIDHINPIKNFGWFGEGDDMIYIDGEAQPSLAGTGTEDYFGAAWGYPSGAYSMPYHGISLAGPTQGPDAYSGKWTMYRYHIEDPVMFEKSIRVTIEAGHANVHANDYASVAYWYQAEPHKPFGALPAMSQRLPRSRADSLRGFWKTR